MRIDEMDPGQKIDMTNPIDDAGLEESRIIHYVELINRDCSEALNAMKPLNLCLYRGINTRNGSPPAFKGRSRENRMSLSGQDEKQIEVDKLLSKNGFKALRSNSIFCTGNGSESAMYGNIYLIFPINGFSFTWADKILDLVTTDIRPIDDTLIKRAGFRNDNLAAAIASDYEIYVHGEYYAFRNSAFGNDLKLRLFQ